MKTRNCVWHPKRPVKAARASAKRILREHADWRKAKRDCPGCKFDVLIYNGHSIWCVSCGLMVPANCIESVKTGRKVRF